MRKQHVPFTVLVELAAAQDWIDARLAESGVARVGETELVRARPWGTVASADTSAGRVYLKAPGPNNLYELPLYRLLNRVVPQAVLKPIAIDEHLGWILLPDGGRSIGEAYDGAEQIEGMALALGKYASLQLELSAHVTEMVDAGVADFGPARLAERLDDAFAAARSSAPDTDAMVQLERRRDEIETWIAALGERPGDATLDHNDLHPRNVLGDPSDPATIRFYDWGDSVVQHPFAAAALPLGVIERSDPAQLGRAVDAYLEPFDTLGTRAELTETLELACRTARVARTMTWHHAISAEDSDPQFASAPFETLNSIFDESWTTRS